MIDQNTATIVLSNYFRTFDRVRWFTITLKLKYITGTHPEPFKHAARITRVSLGSDWSHIHEGARTMTRASSDRQTVDVVNPGFTKDVRQ